MTELSKNTQVTQFDKTAVISRFYAVFSDYGHDLTQKSIWFTDPQKAIDFKNDKMNAKGKYIILERPGENGL
jgi:hypothetical protein